MMEWWNPSGTFPFGYGSKEVLPFHLAMTLSWNPSISFHLVTALWYAEPFQLARHYCVVVELAQDCGRAWCHEQIFVPVWGQFGPILSFWGQGMVGGWKGRVWEWVGGDTKILIITQWQHWEIDSDQKLPSMGWQVNIGEARVWSIAPLSQWSVMCWRLKLFEGEQCLVPFLSWASKSYCVFYTMFQERQRRYTQLSGIDKATLVMVRYVCVCMSSLCIFCCFSVATLAFWCCTQLLSCWMDGTSFLVVRILVVKVTGYSPPPPTGLIFLMDNSPS